MEIIRQRRRATPRTSPPRAPSGPGMFNGHVLADNVAQRLRRHGRWVIGVQLAPDHVRPIGRTEPQQVHLDLHLETRGQRTRSHRAGARLLQAADDLTAAEGHQVYADPAGHPFCLGWGQPDDETIRRILRDHA